MAEIVSEKLVLGGVNMTVRERTQETESRILSPFAALSSKSRGRRRPEDEDELRTVFQHATSYYTTRFLLSQSAFSTI